MTILFFFSSRRRHTRFKCDWSSDVCSSDLGEVQRPGSYRIERNMTLRHALVQGGGPTARGTERGLRVHRRGADDRVSILTPGLNDFVYPEDILFVQESTF